ncbi:P-loop containing nucleoside triphosphate hydrolase protein [Lipomyces japonicus]|uniref:P-loop containing nucleoside triphosphate hydrolase protein n=1 Tax=Lipomyces japonicus TaxID=56871 RepID=UPI0034CD8FE5
MQRPCLLWQQAKCLLVQTRWSTLALARRTGYRSAAFATKKIPQCEVDIAKVRNIGIIAHIDAGKTTTTERMLYYSGHTTRIGNVDEGDTVMDYLPAERNRGITITSAAISLDWNSHRINLIDTPGHADFTFEVIRSIRVLDGAVTILDGVEGVEAQTEKVWQQASDMLIPKIVFVNKMDREGAGFGRTVREIAGKLQARTCIINMPLWKTSAPQGGNGMTQTDFVGVIDVLEMKAIEWTSGGDGEQYSVAELQGTDLEEATRARIALVETLTELDDVLVEKFLEIEDHMMIPSADIKAALRRCTLANQVVPVLCGASFRNIGVQPLLDAVIDYLPSPAERPVAIFTGNKPGQEFAVDKVPEIGCGLAFKVTHDNRTGAIQVFVRVYSGQLDRHATVFNTSNGISEKALKLSRMYADASVDIDHIFTGHIGVISGTKNVRTGDTLLFNLRAVKSTQGKKLATMAKTMSLNSIKVPSPVFFASVEPLTLSETKNLENGLEMLIREDPSLQLTVDEDTGQTQLSGMGELHLEIARDRLIGDMKVKAEIGKVQIAFKESIDTGFGQSQETSYTYSKIVKEKLASTTVTVSLRPIPEDIEYADEDLKQQLSSSIKLNDENYLTLDYEHVTVAAGTCQIDETELSNAIRLGVTSGLSRGSKFGLPLNHVQVVVSKVEVPAEQVNASPVAVASRFAIASAIGTVPADSVVLMEPVMDVTIIVDDEDIGSVMSDLSSTRAGRVYALDDETALLNAQGSEPSAALINADTVYAPPDHTLHLSKHNIRHDLGKKLIRAKVPLSEMVGYLRHLRSITQGRGSFLMQFERYERTSKDRANTIWEKHYA